MNWKVNWGYNFPARGESCQLGFPLFYISNKTNNSNQIQTKTRKKMKTLKDLEKFVAAIPEENFNQDMCGI